MTESDAVPRPGATLRNPLAGRIAAVRRDPLLLNSFFLMLTTVLGAAAGFLFWVIVARLYPVEDVGRASSLLSSVSLLSYFSLFGLSSTLVRHLPSSARPAEDTSTAVTTVAVAAVLVSTAFALLIPTLAPELGFVRASPLHVAVFALLAAGAALNLLTDSVFIALRATRVNLVVNGVLMSAVKLALPAAVVAAGAFGIFTASGIASVVAAAASVAAIRRRLGVRVRPHLSWHMLRATFGYSLSSYVSSSLNLVPQIVLPIVVLQELGPAAAAIYFVAFQIANLVNSASYAIGESLFAEGSLNRAQLVPLARRAGAAMTAVTVPAALVVAALAQPVLRLFGPSYAHHGTGTLALFTLSSLAVAFNTWASFLLKVTRQLVAMVVSNAVLVAVVLGVALLGLQHGLRWAAIAWGAGNAVSGVVAAVALLLPSLRTPSTGRHSRPRRPAKRNVTERKAAERKAAEQRVEDQSVEGRNV
jgi:O-antigen/teichoic acid export membrane protein